MTTVIVAGAGLAGLVAARHLARLGLDVQVFERGPDVGGRVRTRYENGFVLDRGFQVLFTAYPAARRELDYGDLDLRYFAPGAVLARPGRRSVLADPIRDPGALFGSATNREVRFRDKLRTLRLRRELARKPTREIFSGEDQSIEEYLRARGFSDSFRENFAGPFYGGITLDRSLATSKKVFEFTFKMLSTGKIAVPADGMGAISNQLAESARLAGATIHLGEGVSAVESTDDEVSVEVGGETVTADAAIVATDPKSARELTGVESIPTDARGCVTQYFAHDEPLPGGNRIVLNVGDDAPNEIVPLSVVAPEFAPDDWELFSATFLGTPAESDDELAGKVRKTLRQWFPDRQFPNLERLHTDRIEFAQFAQPPGVFDGLPGNRTGDESVYLAGDYTEASSLNAAMESGRKAALAVYDDMR
ncbi:flavin-containing amine-oxidoreductase [Haladaptatus paucihalophilus DX253]|uniref:Flavin-containing amine-oxidoreductase n=1 Tax=Haladaptatus paucihalophilus DX253 TaxID=797209 RepID=E7QRE0_HALPU|nr:NAD(P)/FAD-dependent oxidoreductase [Haladaptatus paucihalophilus]EFW92559.1 flavin-containing amine-oxidoreductase [Haladaptatus paucihalophilus DX253]SHK19271.1 UDP-galactopyranose mutase [Haladaptatus paucihalophilus DX253]